MKNPVFFDLLCRASEVMRRKSEQHSDHIFVVDAIAKMVRSAALFLFEDIPHHRFKVIPESKLEFFREHLYLPFPVVALEDRATATLLADIDTTNRDANRGSSVQRRFIDVFPLSLDLLEEDAFNDAPEILQAMREHSARFPPRTVMISFGFVGYKEIRSSDFLVDGRLSAAFVYSAHTDELSRFSYDSSEDFHRKVLRNVGQSLQWLFILDDPDTFILESSPVSLEKRKFHPDHIPRGTERSTYSLLRPREIRARLGLADPKSSGHAKPVPHERRRHMRRLMSERFTHQKGKLIPVQSCWVGPSEAQVGKRRYRVILDH